MKALRAFPLVAILLLVCATAWGTGTTGGGDFGDARVWLAEITFANTTAAAKVNLPAIWGEPYAYLTTDGFPPVSIVLTDYVAFGDGSTIQPDGIFIGSGLDDPLFVNLGNLTTTWQAECVVVAAGTFKSRVTATNSIDPMTYGAWGSYGTTLPIPTAVYATGFGLGLDWGAAGGHTIGDRWLIQNTIDDVYLGALAGQISTTRADLDAEVVCPVMFFWQPYELTW